MCKDITDAHNQEKNKKRENENKDPIAAMNHSQQKPLTTTEDNTWTTNEILQKQCH
jgi:hypothetical protein